MSDCFVTSEFIKHISGLYHSDLERRLKRCPQCECDYSDVTKRSTGKTCSAECAGAMMSATRHANGSYVRTEEQDRKTSESVRKTYAEREVFTAELRAHISAKSKAARLRGAYDHLKGKHWSSTAEGKARLRAFNLGRVFSDETLAKMSRGAQQRLRTKRETHHTSAKGGFRKDLGIYVRSGWEANFARVLTHLDLKWQYEPKTFQLDNSLSYTPDFYVEKDNAYYEIKGRMNERSAMQLEAMQRLHPDVTVNLVDSVGYSALRSTFKHVVLWEGK